jgi:hypothetical protein
MLHDICKVIALFEACRLYHLALVLRVEFKIGMSVEDWWNS